MLASVCRSYSSLHNPFPSPLFDNPPPLLFHTKDSQNTHRVDAAWQPSREGLRCRCLSKSSLLTVLLMLAAQQQWSRDAGHPALIKKFVPHFPHRLVTVQLRWEKGLVEVWQWNEMRIWNIAGRQVAQRVRVFSPSE